MVELTVDRVATQVHASKVGLLASTAIHQMKLYESIFASRGLATVVPDDALQSQFTSMCKISHRKPLPVPLVSKP
jgi:aspartate/glutamate racemase